MRTNQRIEDIDTIAASYENFILQFGRAESISAESVIWNTGGAYTGYLTSENYVTVVSTDDDDKVGGGGATVVRLIGQGEDGLEKRVDITLNGQTPVHSDAFSTEKFNIIYGFLVRFTEDDELLTGPNHGIISVYEKGVALNVMAVIKAKNGSALMCIYRVPSNKYAHVDHLDVYPIAAQPVVIAVNIRPLPELAWLKVGEADFDRTTLNFILKRPVFLLPRADIALSVIPSTPTSVAALFELELFDLEV